MAKLNQAQILAVFGMPPKAAVAYLEQKGLRLTGDWHEMLNEDHAAAFTIANCAKLDVVQDIYSAVLDSVKNGTTERDFIKRLTPVLQSKGWWGKETNDDGSTTQLGSPRRLQTIYRTNNQSNYMAGRYHEMVKGAATHPYWKYISLLDGKTRPSHRSMNGRIFKWDDPVWTFAFPPNGYNCRCRVVAVSQASVDESNDTVEDSAGRIIKKDVQIGKDADGNPLLSDVTGIKLPTTGDKSIHFFTDAGFDVNQGMAATEHAARIFASKVEKADPAIGAVAMNAARDWLMPQLKAEYRTWAQAILSKKQAAGAYRVIGALTPEVLQTLGDLDVLPTSVALTLRDQELLHLARDTKTARGASLPISDILNLPELLANPQAILYDQQDPALVYVLGSGDDANKVVVRTDYTVKVQADGKRGNVTSNAIRTAGKAGLLDLGSTRYQLISGSLE
jgi:SPP1 gp7 family putative phage head morphogenesis protein